MNIPFNKPYFDTTEEQAALRVLRSGHLTQGAEVLAFEQEFASYIKAPYVVAVDNCTNALWLSLQYLKETEGELIVGCPAMTFASVANAIIQTGHQLKFEDSYYAGSAYRLNHTNIWDCAHEILRFQKGQVQCYSFYPNKVLCSAEGGAIATDNKAFYDWLLLARNNGRQGKTSYHYSIDMLGWKMNMTDLQAAILRAQLIKLPYMLERRDQIKACYNKYFKRVNQGNYLYVIAVKNRAEFMSQMLYHGIETSYHYKPLYDQPAYQDIFPKPGLLRYRLTEKLKDRIVTLPLYPQMSGNQIQQVIKLTKLYAKFASKDQTYTHY